ncbi:hypothetical protein Bcop_1485 [Bacteroides coprosuis DSM 18011]|uniref:Uncharacterized protein n=1 Tax=Bacteroides coprosuis DSM 18011 TaxID=679937 RepID=F3ZPU2_9BACE|nr:MULTISPECIES: hypothetical protein [Bacteroides]EGJ71679.1 hypothetical protein Bcop_1485 [Bacteroides coprosuis DSM 18011]HJD91798.1 hypothetical protein [Bacteroides coprosuis]
MSNKTLFFLCVGQIFFLYFIMMIVAKYIDKADLQFFYLSFHSAPKATSFFLLGSAIMLLNTIVFNMRSKK